MYFNISNKSDENPDVYADFILKYISAIIELSKYAEDFVVAKDEMERKILLLDTNISRPLSAGTKTYTYKYAYTKNSGGACVRMTNKQYAGRRKKWEMSLSIYMHCNQLEIIINNIEKNLENYIQTPKSQPTLAQIKQLTIKQTQLMKNLYEQHKLTNPREKSPYIHNCMHEDGTQLISRAELLIYECIKKCGLQAIYEYLYTHEKTKTTLRPDFYGYRHTKPFIIEFFGMMNQHDYKERVMKKIIDYKNCGFVLGENLIAFCTEKNGDINMKTIHTVLKNFSVYGSIPKNMLYVDQPGQAV